MPENHRPRTAWCASDPPDCSGLVRHRATPCPRMDECHAARGLTGAGAERRCLQPGQPILVVYPAESAPREVFGEVKLLLKSHYLVRLYLEDGATDAILLQSRGRAWRDLTNGQRAWVVEELSGPQLSRFLLYRDYSRSGCAARPQPALNGLRATA